MNKTQPPTVKKPSWIRQELLRLAITLAMIVAVARVCCLFKKQEVVAGQVWESTFIEENPFERTEPDKYTVLQVREGWVKWQYGTSQGTNHQVGNGWIIMESSRTSKVGEFTSGKRLVKVP